MVLKVAVVGSGVAGLSTALCLAEDQSLTNFKAQITVVSDKDLRDVTSWGPPGIFRPDVHLDESLATPTFERLLRVCASEPKSGVQYLSGYFFSDDAAAVDTQYRKLTGRVPDCHYTSAQEHRLYPSAPKKGICFTTVTSEGNLYLPWLVERLKERGCRFAKRKIASFDELYREGYDLVVNCTGLAAGSLANDPKVRPIRGVFLKVKAPWLKQFVFKEFDTYIVPGVNFVYLGGFKQYDNADLKITEFDVTDIFRRCRELAPGLRHAEFLGVWAGIRPHRDGGPRIETETRLVDGRKYPLIHNYGHGGSGFTMSWGSALKVRQLVEDSARNSNFSAAAKL